MGVSREMGDAHLISPSLAPATPVSGETSVCRTTKVRRERRWAPMIDSLIEVLKSWGLAGLLVAAFTEAFCSPILPDIILIPLAFAHPSMGVYYGLAATLASVTGGIIGYGIGKRIGPPAARKMIPPKYFAKIQNAVNNHAKWAIFIAAISPIPYKFISIGAGALKINMKIFLLISLIARGKRFLLEGILIYYYGPQAVYLFTNHSDDIMLWSLVLVVAVVALALVYKRLRRSTAWR
ncbi:MAG TPA: VTT domain-containing protein [Patescibacteria group bacterium]|nr:VTT domain-containing protein [Patescibacteria group bacterium]